MKTTFAALVLMFGMMASMVGQEQGIPAPAQPKPDSPEVVAHTQAAQKAAGTAWKAAADFFCSPAANRANRPDDPLLPATRIFDNLYVIGRAGTAVFAVSTSEGVVLIDAGYADQLESVLLSGLRDAGLDEANVKYILLGHGHADHYGGAAYFQQKHGTRIAMAGADWDLVENPPAPRGRGAPAAAAAAPKRDVVLSDGQVLTVGDQKFTIVAIPGHTAGSVGVIFPVKEGRVTHTAGLFGGTILIPGRISDASLQEYLRSIERFGTVARTMNVDIEIQNHPLYDNITEKVMAVRAGKKGADHPFVVGKDAYQRFLTVQAECMRAQIARRSAGS